LPRLYEKKIKKQVFGFGSGFLNFSKKNLLFLQKIIIYMQPYGMVYNFLKIFYEYKKL
jgi:hypothetical protein